MTYRSELIQVAAVAVAMIEDFDIGITGDATATENVLVEVAQERMRQEAKWGTQHHTPVEWLAILGEEVGEACHDALEAHEGPERQQQVFDAEKETT